MAHPLLSRRKAHSLGSCLFLLILAILAYTKYWWPGLLLAFGLSMALRQYLLGKRFDMFISLFVFLGAYITVQFKIAWEVILPVIFLLGALYVFLKEFIGPKERDEIEIEEDMNEEIKEDEE